MPRPRHGHWGCLTALTRTWLSCFWKASCQPADQRPLGRWGACCTRTALREAPLPPHVSFLSVCGPCMPLSPPGSPGWAVPNACARPSPTGVWWPGLWLDTWHSPWPPCPGSQVSMVTPLRADMWGQGGTGTGRLGPRVSAEPRRHSTQGALMSPTASGPRKPFSSSSKVPSVTFERCGRQAADPHSGRLSRLLV